MKAILAPLFLVFFLVSCVDLEEYIDLSTKSKPYLYFKLKIARSADQTPFGASQAELVLKDRLSQIKTNGASFSLKTDLREGAFNRPSGLELEGALTDDMKKVFSNTPLAPVVSAAGIEIPFDLRNLYEPFDSGDTNAYLTGILGGLKIRLMIKPTSGEFVTGARFYAAGVVCEIPAKFLKDFYLIEVPLEFFAPAYKQALLQIDLGNKTVSNRLVPFPDLKSRRLGEMFQKGIMYFDQGDFLTAHGIFARLVHEKRMVSGDLYFFYAFTTSQIDRDDAMARAYYLLALDALKKSPSIVPWEKSRDRSWLMLGLMYANPRSSQYNLPLAKKTFDSALKENPANEYVRKVYTRVTGSKP